MYLFILKTCCVSSVCWILKLYMELAHSLWDLMIWMQEQTGRQVPYGPVKTAKAECSVHERRRPWAEHGSVEIKDLHLYCWVPAPVLPFPTAETCTCYLQSLSLLICKMRIIKPSTQSVMILAKSLKQSCTELSTQGIISILLLLLLVREKKIKGDECFL